MRHALLGSTLAHVLLVAALFVTRHATSISLPGGDAVPVTLVDPAALRAPAAAPAPAPAPEPPAEEDAVRIEPRKPKPKPEPPPKRVEPPREPPHEAPARETAPAAGVSLPSAAVGSAGLRGDLGVDATDFAFAYYLALVRDRIAARWGPPAGLATGGRVVRSVVQFRIARDGRVTGVGLEQGSGLEPFDRSALRAVVLSDPLPPLPAGYAGRDLGVHFGFEWGTP